MFRKKIIVNKKYKIINLIESNTISLQKNDYL